MFFCVCIDFRSSKHLRFPNVSSNKSICLLPTFHSLQIKFASILDRNIPNGTKIYTTILIGMIISGFCVSITIWKWKIRSVWGVVWAHLQNVFYRIFETQIQMYRNFQHKIILRCFTIFTKTLVALVSILLRIKLSL